MTTITNNGQEFDADAARTVRSIVVNWVDEKTVIAKAKEAGWTEGESVMDFVNDPNDYSAYRVFSSMTKAKAWARRNKALDFWGDPDITVYEWPDARKLSWERECVLHLRYMGEDGVGWQEVDVR